jgi:predicted acetyltransferase
MNVHSRSVSLQSEAGVVKSDSRECRETGAREEKDRRSVEDGAGELGASSEKRPCEAPRRCRGPCIIMSTMGEIEIRPLGEEEFHEAVVVSCTAFGEQATEEDERAHRLGFPFERALCAYEDGRMVGTSTVLPFELTLPGGAGVPTAGLTWVAVLPTHRRRGILRRLVRAQLGGMANRGELLSALIASEANIYGRFGYGPATGVVSFSVERAYAAFAEPAQNPGRVVLLSGDEATVQLPQLYERLRHTQPGAVSRSAGWWTEYLYDPLRHREGGSAMFHAQHETSAGVPDGYVTYRVKDEWEGALPLSSVLVVELMAEDPEVYHALWDFILGTDLCRTVSFSRARVDEPLRWLLADPRRFRVDALVDYLWLRILDVRRALEARTYACGGRVVLEVTSGFPAPNVDRFVLTVDPGAGKGECVPTTTSPDLRLGLDSLGAAYLGGVSFSELARGRRVHELVVGAVARADSMFRTNTAPYCVTEF